MLRDGITEVDYTYEDIRVTGVLGNSTVARSNRNGQLFFVNQRYVKDKTLTSSVDQAYKNLLPMGKYAFTILNLEMDPSQVDCNVHPAKLEVRFADEQKVFKAIYHAIKSKDEELMSRVRIMPEIENQAQIEQAEVKQEDKQEQIEKQEIVEIEKEEFKPREGTFSGFFKMFKNKDDEEENTIIKDIYEARKNEEVKHENVAEVEENNNPVEPENLEKQEIEIKQEIKPEIKLDDTKPQEVKIGNTIISSDTRESAYDVKDLEEAIKQETLKLDSTKFLSANDSKTEIMDSLKKIEEDNKRETVIVNTEEVRSEDTVSENEEVDEKNPIAERLLEQKEKTDMEDTQFIDTGKVRKELRTSKNDDGPVTKDFANMYKKVFGTEVSTVRKTREEENAKLDVSDKIQIVEEIENETIFNKKENTEDDQEVNQEVEEEIPTIQYKYIGTIFDTFAIIEVKDEMYMIEKNAAEERLMYEVVKANYYNDEVDDAVSLLLADIVTLSNKEMSIARDLKGMFRKSGFDYDDFGECTLKLTKVPSWAEKLNTKKLFVEILKEMDTVAVTATQEKEEKFIATVSNKYVMLSDTTLSNKEFEDLIARLLRLPSPFMYPNGRLTAVKNTKTNMEKKFSRR